MNLNCITNCAVREPGYKLSYDARTTQQTYTLFLIFHAYNTPPKRATPLLSVPRISWPLQHHLGYQFGNKKTNQNGHVHALRLG